ncbi:MAG: hypothetical protein H7647_08270 [Candidatus Heimdallarchaeota archaeon]|nr:hypothetical protein [Candidatus Heimdallarchaeota archaeon]MCK4254422.1 hypothetical protein [Candidatus Heimdallarchaeota archaeon]
MEILDYVNGIYAITVGVSLNLFWIVIFVMKSSHKLIEDSKERLFHVIAEIFISSLALIAGIAIFYEQEWGLYVFAITMGALTYACINAVGIYSKKKLWLLVSTLALVGIVSTILLLLNLITIITT